MRAENDHLRVLDYTIGANDPAVKSEKLNESLSKVTV
jgi:hypothetical protein